MLKIQTNIDIGTIVQVRTAYGHVRWFRLCASCGDAQEIGRPVDADAEPILCPPCADDMAEEFRREAAQEAYDRRRAWLP